MKRFKLKIAAILAIVLFLTFLEPQSLIYAKVAPIQSMVTLSVRSSQTSIYESRLDIDNSKIIQALKNAKFENAANDAPILPDIYLSLLQDNQERSFRMEETGGIWEESTSKRLIVPSEISKKLLNYSEILRKIHYGKLISWKEASSIIPLKSIFTITDLATGLSFQVQRRAGKDHADVQPLTKKDTSIMKHIYHNSWSWRRTAILVNSNHEFIAASMNGMPHGGDGIPGNDFSGHFCVHFLNSSTHKSPNPDLAHQLMVYKAAGNLKTFFGAASPLIMAKSFVEAMNQQDPDLLQQASVGIPKEKAEFFMQEMKSLLSIQPKKPQGKRNEISINDPRWDESLTAEVALKVVIYKNGASKRESIYRFTFNRGSKQSPWLMSDVVPESKLKT
jgi:hypothetical protein